MAKEEHGKAALDDRTYRLYNGGLLKDCLPRIDAEYFQRAAQRTS